MYHGVINSANSCIVAFPKITVIAYKCSPIVYYFAPAHEIPKMYMLGLLSFPLDPEISPIFINRTDARRHVANRSTKCVIAFGFNARARENGAHTRHPANRILHVNSRMNGHRRADGGGERAASCDAEVAMVWYGDTRFTFWNPRRQWGTTSAIVINVIDLVRSALALLPAPFPPPFFHQPLRSSVATLCSSFLPPSPAPFVDQWVARCRRCTRIISVLCTRDVSLSFPRR